jgi:CBS domain-containing protein
MRIRDIMSSPVVSLTSETTVKEAARLLVDRSFNALPVVDGGRLVGIVTEADLVPLESRPDPRSHMLPLRGDFGEVPHAVAQVMTAKVITLPAEEDAARAAHLMLQRSLRSMSGLKVPPGTRTWSPGRRGPTSHGRGPATTLPSR